MLTSAVNLFYDIGQLLRLNKRSNSYTSITSTQLYYDIKNMLLLRGDSHFSKLIILRSHTQMFHSVVESTLSNIRLYYWIIRGRFFVKGYFSLIACTAAWAVCIEFASGFSSNSLALTLRVNMLLVEEHHVKLLAIISKRLKP